MEGGLIVDRGHYGIPQVLCWVTGAVPKKELGTAKFLGFDTGRPKPTNLTIGVKGKQLHPVQTLRCSRCGFLESYAE